MNWGHKIAILYSGFVVLILTLVFLANREKVDLVSADYYDQEIKFQDKIDASKNAYHIDSLINFEAGNKTLLISFPKAMQRKISKGEIRLYRPSDENLDYKTALVVSADCNQKISSPTFKRGIYKMQINWSMDNEHYFIEKTVFMN